MARFGCLRTSDFGCRLRPEKAYVAVSRSLIPDSMPPIVISEDAFFGVSYRNDALLVSLTPFIDAVSSGVALTGSLEESVMKAADLYPSLASHFIIESRKIDQTFGLRDRYLFPKWKPRALNISFLSSTYQIDLTGAGAQLLELVDLLRLCSSGRFQKEEIRTVLHEDALEVFNTLLEVGVVQEIERPAAAFAPAGIPGIYRLQHASLLYRSLRTGILVDPHLHSAYNPGQISDICRDQLQDKVDGILVSHFHLDHWSLSTLSMFPRHIPIVVPKVPRSTIICGDMRRLLLDMGFRNVISVDWYSDPITIGDIQIYVLPFFGEQPLRFDVPKDSRIRNWGNTYVIRTEHYSSWFLIDSGNDALGTMADVAQQVITKVGKIDFILSNLRQFRIWGPVYINGGANWLTLSPQQIRDFKSMSNHCITLGPDGVAEVCKVVQARYYLPYAHWWGSIGSEGKSEIDTPGRRETDLLQELEKSLVRIRAATDIVPWKIGDGFVRTPEGNFDVVRLRR